MGREPQADPGREPQADPGREPPADPGPELRPDDGPAPRPGPPPAPRLPQVTGIVLAGGLSRRFGEAAEGTALGPDKLAAPFGDGTVLGAAIRSVAAVTDEVVLALRPVGDEPPLPPDLPAPVRIVRDVEEGGGPLAALPAALLEAASPVALVVAGDTPHLPPAIARLLLDAIAGPGPARPGLGVGGDRGRAAAAALLVRGTFEPLPIALRRDRALHAAYRLLAEERRSIRDLLAFLAATAIPEAAWRTVDPDGLALRDVDLPGDLADLEETPMGGDR